MTDQKTDMVNHPPHYTTGGIEVIDFIDFMVNDPADYYIGNVVKYLSRAGKKGDAVEDYRKARWYLERLYKKYKNRWARSAVHVISIEFIIRSANHYCLTKGLPRGAAKALIYIKRAADSLDAGWLPVALAELDELIEQEVKDGHSV